MADLLQDKIHTKLEMEFSPTHLKIINESHLHAGHAQAGDAIDTHFRIQISAGSFKKLSRVVAHRKIYAALSEWMNNPIHALAIEIN